MISFEQYVDRMKAGVEARLVAHVNAEAGSAANEAIQTAVSDIFTPYVELAKAYPLAEVKESRLPTQLGNISAVLRNASGEANSFGNSLDLNHNPEELLMPMHEEIAASLKRILPPEIDQERFRAAAAQAELATRKPLPAMAEPVVETVAKAAETPVPGAEAAAESAETAAKSAEAGWLRRVGETVGRHKMAAGAAAAAVIGSVVWVERSKTQSRSESSAER